MARPTLQPAVGRRSPGERPVRNELCRRPAELLRPVLAHRVGRRGPAPPLAQHQPHEPGLRHLGHVRRPRSRLRVRRGSRQRLPSCRTDRSLDHRAHDRGHGARSPGSATFNSDDSSQPPVTGASASQLSGRVHHITFYKTANGALVLGVGTNQWGYGLDSHAGASGTTPDVRIKQATVNVLADMGVQPDTLVAGLVVREPVHRHGRAHVQDHRAGRRDLDGREARSRSRAPPATPAVATSVGSRCPLMAARVGTPPPVAASGPTCSPRTWPPGLSPFGAAPRTTAATSRAPAPGVTITITAHLPVQHLQRDRPNRHRLRRLLRSKSARSSDPNLRAYHRAAVLQIAGEHRHPRRPPLGRRRHPARNGDVHR